MANKKVIESNQHELPSQFADRLGLDYAKSVNQGHKKANGQFFTPVEIANLMGTFTDYDQTKIRILDPGCGAAILTCSVLEKLTETAKKLKTVDLIVYETDLELIPYTKTSLDYLKEWLAQKNLILEYTIKTTDFIRKINTRNKC